MAFEGRPLGFLLGEVLASLIAIVLLTGLGWWRAAGFNGPTHWRALHVICLPALIALLPLLSWLDPNRSIPLPGTATIAFIAVTTFSLGLNRDDMVRTAIHTDT